jgi:chemotaxis protein methyltransferase WspC
MILTPVIELLRERIGLAPESLGASLLSGVVGARMRALGLSAPADYAARLTADPQEFGALAADLTVPETWFFRGGEVFPFLARHIAGAIRRRPAGPRYRTLSVPCSTGEEPYSLALALIESGVAPGSWQIDAVDLSPRHIERACRGVYGEFSFRQTDPRLRQRYFRPTAAGWELDSAVRALVRFREGNLLAPFFLAGEEPFDLIFCRNLFIYLHPAARRRALETLDRLLAADGWLCMGHAEPIEFSEPRFVRAGPVGSFLYQRVPAGGARPTASGVVGRAPPPGRVPAPAPAAAPAAVDSLDQARQLADRGQLDEALAACRTAQSRGEASALLFSLMGELHQARREKDEARRCFERALYLDPGQRDALTHLMLLCQDAGDDAQAARLRRRLERAAAGGEP